MAADMTAGRVPAIDSFSCPIKGRGRQTLPLGLAGRGREALLIGEAKWSRKVSGPALRADLERKAAFLPKLSSTPTYAVRADELHDVKSSKARRQDEVAAQLEPFGIGLDDLVLRELLHAKDFSIECLQDRRQSVEVLWIWIRDDVQILGRTRVSVRTDRESPDYDKPHSRAVQRRYEAADLERRDSGQVRPVRRARMKSSLFRERDFRLLCQARRDRGELRDEEAGHVGGLLLERGCGGPGHWLERLD